MTSLHATSRRRTGLAAEAAALEAELMMEAAEVRDAKLVASGRVKPKPSPARAGLERARAARKQGHTPVVHSKAPAAPAAREAAAGAVAMKPSSKPVFGTSASGEAGPGPDYPPPPPVVTAAPQWQEGVGLREAAFGGGTPFPQGVGLREAAFGGGGGGGGGGGYDVGVGGTGPTTSSSGTGTSDDVVAATTTTESVSAGAGLSAEDAEEIMQARRDETLDRVNSAVAGAAKFRGTYFAKIKRH